MPWGGLCLISTLSQLCSHCSHFPCPPRAPRGRSWYLEDLLDRVHELRAHSVPGQHGHLEGALRLGAFRLHGEQSGVSPCAAPPARPWWDPSPRAPTQGKVTLQGSPAPAARFLVRTSSCSTQLTLAERPAPCCSQRPVRRDTRYPGTSWPPKPRSRNGLPRDDLALRAAKSLLAESSGHSLLWKLPDSCLTPSGAPEPRSPVASALPHSFLWTGLCFCRSPTQNRPQRQFLGHCAADPGRDQRCPLPRLVFTQAFC